jgi:hypothetical protein
MKVVDASTEHEMKNRDSAYFRGRLAKDHPAILAEVHSGRLSVRAASAKAGLIHLPTRLDALKREWKKAARSDQVEFVKWLKAGAWKTRVRLIADRKGRLRGDVRAFLSRWVATHRSRPGRIMKQMGFSGFDYTLAAAIVRRSELRAEVITKLDARLKKEGF